MEASSARRTFLLAMLASMCATAALAIGILLFSEFDETAVRILGSTAALSFFSLLALPAGVLLDRGGFVGRRGRRSPSPRWVSCSFSFCSGSTGTTSRSCCGSPP